MSVESHIRPVFDALVEGQKAKEAAEKKAKAAAKRKSTAKSKAKSNKQ